jgi:hypothetical protein
MVSVNFADTTDHIGISWLRKWLEIYYFIDMATKSDKSPPMAARDSDEDDNDNEIYNEDLLRVQRSERSEIHKITSRPVSLPITNVMQWIATHVDFRRMVVMSGEGKVLGILTPNSFHNMNGRHV